MHTQLQPSLHSALSISFRRPSPPPSPPASPFVARRLPPLWSSRRLPLRRSLAAASSTTGCSPPPSTNPSPGHLGTPRNLLSLLCSTFADLLPPSTPGLTSWTNLFRLCLAGLLLPSFKHPRASDPWTKGGGILRRSEKKPSERLENVKERFRIRLYDGGLTSGVYLPSFFCI